MNVRLILLGNGAVGAEKQVVALGRRLTSCLREHGVKVTAPHFVRPALQTSSFVAKLPPAIQLLTALATQNALFGYAPLDDKAHDLIRSIGTSTTSMDVVIGSGRTTVSLCAAMRLLNKRTCSVQVQHPRIPLSFFNAVVTPQHDFRRVKQHERLYLTTGTVFDMQETKLREEEAKWAERLAIYRQKRFRVVLLIGGPCRGFPFSKEDMEYMMKELDTAIGSRVQDVSVLVSFSRRTPREVKDMFVDYLERQYRQQDVFIYDGQGDNPYYAFLSMATAIVTTPDSVSMTTEAIAANRPVFTFTIDRCKGKFRRFHDGLLADNLSSPLTPSCLTRTLGQDTTHHTKLDEELQDIVEKISTQLLGT